MKKKKLLSAFLALVLLLGLLTALGGAAAADPPEEPAPEDRLAKYAGLKARITELEESFDALIAAIKAKDPTDSSARLLYFFRAFLGPLSDRLDAVMEAISDYHEGKTDRLSPLLFPDEIALDGTALDYEWEYTVIDESGAKEYTGFRFLDPDSGEAASSARIFRGSVYEAFAVLGDPDGVKRDLTEGKGDLADAVELARHALDSGNAKSAAQALFAYVDGLEKAADYMKASGLEKAMETIRDYDEDHVPPSEFAACELSTLDNELWEQHCELCSAYIWLAYQYMLADYGAYLSNHPSGAAEEEAMLAKINEYTFREWTDTASMLTEELIPRLFLLPLLPDGAAWAGGDGAGDRTAKYAELKDAIDETLDYVDALIEAHGDEADEIEEQHRKPLAALADKLEAAAEGVSAYFSGIADTLPFAFESGDARRIMSALGAVYGDPSGAARDLDVIAADVNAALADARTAIEKDNLIIAERAMLEYSDALETAANSIAACGIPGACGAISDLKEIIRTQDLHSSGLRADYDYYEWLPDYYRLLDYRDYLLDREDNLSEDEAALLQEIEAYTMFSLTEERPGIVKSIFSYFLKFDAPADAAFVSAPIAAGPDYDGAAHPLLRSGGTAEGGLPRYALGDSADTPPKDGDFGPDIPAAAEPGTYYVWVMVRGDIGHRDSEKQCIEAAVGKRKITVTAGSASRAYDGTALTSSVYSVTSDTDLAAGDWISEITVSGSQTDAGKSDNVPAGAKIRSAEGRDVTGFYDVTYEKGTLEVTKKAVSVSVDPDQGKTYGDADPTLTATADGVVGEDTLNYSLSRAVGENVGEYAVTVTPGENPNYTVTVTNGTFTISKKPASVSVVSGQGKIYGDADPGQSHAPTAGWSWRCAVAL